MGETASAPLPAGQAPAGRPEQRSAPRFRVDGAIVSLAKPGMLASLGLGLKTETLVNLSPGGVLVRASKSLVVGSRVRVRIEVPKWKDVIACDAEVRWCAQSARVDLHFYAGLAFRGLPDLDAKRIAQMHELLKSVEYRAKAGARKEASSANLQKPKF